MPKSSLLKKRKPPKRSKSKVKSKGKIVAKKTTKDKKQNITQTVIVNTAKPKTKRTATNPVVSFKPQSQTPTDTLIASLINKFNTIQASQDRSILQAIPQQPQETKPEPDTKEEQMIDTNPSTDHTIIKGPKRGRPTRGENEELASVLRGQVIAYIDTINAKASPNKKEQKTLKQFNASTKSISHMDVSDLKKYTHPSLKIQSANIEQIKRVLNDRGLFKMD